MRICWPAGQQASFSEAVLGKTDLSYGVERMSQSAHNTSRICKPSTFSLIAVHTLLFCTHLYCMRSHVCFLSLKREAS